MNTHYVTHERSSPQISNQKLQKKKESSIPIVYHSDYKNSYETILYRINPKNTYGGLDFRYFYKINFDEYYLGYDKKNKTIKWKNSSLFRTEPNASLYDNQYAIGIRINPFYSKLILLDFDGVDLYFMKRIAKLFMKDNVNAIDIVNSAPDRNVELVFSKHYHLIIGLDSYYNILSLYSDSAFPGSCDGFFKIAENIPGELILRISEKKNYFNVTNISPLVEKSYRKIDNEWLSFDMDNVIYPYVDSTEKKTSERKIKSKITLRGKHDNKCTKPKSQRQKTTTIDSVKDIETFSKLNR